MTTQHVGGLLWCVYFFKLVVYVVEPYDYFDAYFGVCLCDVLRMISIYGYLILILMKTQMPPRRANSNPNNNNVTPEMQQLMTSQAQLMQMMTTFMQNQ